MNITKCALALTLGAIAAVSANGETADTHTGVVAANPEDAVKKQARSVHLTYLGLPPKMIAAAATVTVRETAPGTYFSVMGWSCGYCGIQELWNGSHAVIFSVWDPVDPHDYSAQPDAVRAEHRAKVIYADPLMDVARFGGEGSGARTMAGYGWKVGSSVRLRVTSEPDGTNRTAFTCWLRDASNAGTWHRLATISTMNRNGEAPGLENLYSFVEDFRRDYDSATRMRRAEYSDIEGLSAADGKWHPITRAAFTGDRTPSTNVDAGRVPGNPRAFFLATGGATTNATTQLWHEIK